MDSVRRFLVYDWHRLVIPFGLLVLTLLAGYVFKTLLFRALRRWAVKSTSHLDIILTESLRGPIMIWALILGLYWADQMSDLPPRVAYYTGATLISLWIISITLMASKLAGNIVKFYGARVSGELPITSLTKNLAQLVVIAIGTLTLLHSLGVPIAPVLGALGVGGLAVALALQDTLSNLFAGFYVSVAGQIRPGDYIKLNTGEEGYVTDISWRSTNIRALAHNLIIIPNSKLGQAIVTNYFLPDKRMVLPIVVGVSYESDPDHVERVLLEEAGAALKEVPGLLSVPEPNARLVPGFGDSAMQFTLECQISEFAEQFRIQHELRKRILKRFRAESINLAFPTRTVYLREERPDVRPA